MMTTKRVLLHVALATAVFAAARLSAQEYQFSFKGTQYETNAEGKIVSTKITEQDLVKRIADHAGITDLSTLGIAYHVNGTAFGDTVEIIDPQTGQTLDLVFGLYFGEAFGRQVLSGSTGERRLDYVYTEQNTHSLGSALISKTEKKDKQGNVISTSISGPVKYMITSEGTNNLVFIVGTFKTGSLLSFTNSP